MVESTPTSHTIAPAASASTCNAVRIYAHTPQRCQRRNSPYIVCHGPYRAGTSRPGGTRADPPPDSVDELVFRPFRRAARLLRPGQQRSQPRPLRVGQVCSPRHRHPGHEVSGIQGFDRSLNPDTGDLAHPVATTHLPCPNSLTVSTFERCPSSRNREFPRRSS